MGSLSNGTLRNEVSNKRRLGEEHCVSSITAKYKKRKVSAVRVFPPGCGPNAPKIKAIPENNEKKIDFPFIDDVNVLENNDNKIDFLVVDGVNVSENGDKLLSHEDIKSPSDMEIFGSLNDLVGKVVSSASETVNGDDVASSIKPLGDDFWQTLQIDAPEFSHYFDKLENSDVVKVDGTMETKPEVEMSENKISLAQDLPMDDGNVIKSNSREIKYPRRRVSANREFPPFCGRNALCPTEEERAKIMFSNRATQRCGELMEIKRIKKEEKEADVKDENKKIEELEKVVPEVKTETSLVKTEVDASIISEIIGSGTEESDKEVRESDSPKGKMEVRARQQETKGKTVNKTEYNNEKNIRENVSKEIVVYADKSLDISHSDDYDLGGDFDESMVQGLIAGPSSPLRYEHNKKEEKMKYASGKVGESNNLGRQAAKKTHAGNIVIKKNKFVVQEQAKFDNSEAKSSKKRPVSTKIMVKKKGLSSQEQNEVSHVSHKSKEVELNLPPFGPSRSGEGSMRNKVRETLRLFQAICRKILQGEEANLNKQGKASKRIDLDAAKIIKLKGKEVNTGAQIIGSVPGVEVGDEFLYRVELALVGVHRLYQAGIDYMMNNGMIICVSIVASGGYADELDNPDILIYSGQGGMPGGKNKEKQAKDQKLERGNLAMKNSITAKNPVRVIRGTKEKVSRADSRTKMVPSYAYDGLYIVEKYWQEVGHNGKLVFKFELRRIPGQPELAWKEVKKSKKFKSREGVCDGDISNGKEVFRICAVNNVDNEKPPVFNYITKMIYPSWYSPTPLEGCDCVDGCSDSRKCSCVIKNGEGIPYNYNGAIVEAKPLVHECGPSCKCPPSCYNRVTQHGMKIQLEIFKTNSRGWGVRSLNSIPSGSFICEYIGELLEDKEAEQRRNDEYLFDIGKNYSDCSHQLYSENSLDEVAEESGFTIDAAVYGNIGRFINHSCSPNLYAQNVLYDHEDKTMPHIMLFAAENIPPLQELTYHYNYSVGQVRDANGNVKIKNCYCGSEECTGRMY